MRRRSFLLGAAVLLATAGVADARMHAPYRGHRIVPATAAPLDGFTVPAAAYSFRKLRSNYTGPAARIRRASDSAETDINFLGFVPGLGAPWDEAAAAAYCAATTCTVVLWYDQSGNGRNAAPAAAANRPPLQFGCLNLTACMNMGTADFRFLQVAGFVPTAIQSLSMVAKRQSGSGACQMAVTSTFLWAPTAANTWQLAGTGSIGLAAADGAWHAGVGVVNGAASVLRVDSAEQAGTVTAATSGGTFYPAMGAASGTACSFVESIQWNSTALSAAERAALTANQKAFWGF